MSSNNNSVHELIEVIQQIAVNAVSGGKPLEVRIGYVERVNPIVVELIGGFRISESMLTLSDSVKDREVEVEIEWGTEVASQHTHGITGVKKMTIKNGLQVGERVVILRSQGGEKHLVLDRI